MLKKQNGITLIALIITIIVMLILVGVTINVVVNGGLFSKAKEAATELEKRAIHEQIIMGMQLDNGKIDVEETVEEAQKTLTEYTVTEKSSGTNYKVITVTGKNGTYIYTITDEEITIGEKIPGLDTGTFDWYEKFELTIDTEAEYEYAVYVLKFEENGMINITENGVPLDPINAKNIEGETLQFPFTVGGQAYNTTVTMNSNGVDLDVELTGLDTVTYVKKTANKGALVYGKVYSNAEVLQVLGETGGTYKGTWTVIEIDSSGNPTKLVSTSEVANCTLGEDDNLEKCIEDYKNAVSILNTAAQEATGITGARSINIEDIETLAGIEDSDKGDNYNQPYTYNYTNHKDQTFVNESGATVKLDAEGKEVTLKHTYYYSKQLSSDDIGTLASGYYWLASPCVSCDSGNAFFYVRCMRNGIIGSDSSLFISHGSANSGSNGVRAVVSVEGL